VSPTTAADVFADLGDDVDVILDGGPCRVGVESTIVDCSRPEPAILRLGGTPRERVEELLGRPVPLLDAGEVRAPGTLASHYAPRADVEFADLETLDAILEAARERDERVGVIGADVGDDDPAVEVLGVPRDGDEYAHDLYRMLRDADVRGLDRVIAVLPDPAGLGAAVADRLRRAAGSR
jgi:L-threonylcarbamoyladenylate synthase